jgi:ABC-type antimicrobial peptide transport system permease subunit
VAFVVGTVIVYQILYTDISDHMAEYATLKAMGYGGFFLCSVVLQEALILAVIGYIPGFAIAVFLYELTLRATSGTLPVSMDLDRADLCIYPDVDYVQCVGANFNSARNSVRSGGGILIMLPILAILATCLVKPDLRKAALGNCPGRSSVCGAVDVYFSGVPKCPL